MPVDMTWKSYTDYVNRIENESDFLMSFFGGITTDMLSKTEKVELSYYDGQRKMAPMVRRGSEAKMISGPSRSFETVESPNIRIKVPYTPDNKHVARLPGTSSHPTAGEMAAAIQRDKLLHIDELRRQANEREEWLWAQVLTGSISYAFEDGDTWQVTFPRPAANDITLAGGDLWSAASTADPRKNLDAASRLTVPFVGEITHAIMGKDAAAAFMDIEKIEKHLQKDSGYRAGPALDLTKQISDKGARAVAQGLYGIDWWEYDRETLDHEGSTVTFIDPKKVYFIARNPNLRVKRIYGAIEDLDAFSGNSGNLGMMRRFAKSWRIQDPSQEIHLFHTRPMPFIQRGEGIVSMQVLS